MQQHHPKDNHLFAALSAPECERLFPHLEIVTLPVGHTLSEAGDPRRYVYFPVDSIVSLLHVTQNGASMEIAAVGNEGIVGIELFMGGDSPPNRAVVQSAGHAFRIKAEIVKQEFTRGGMLHNILLRYTQALLTQMAQIAVCNRHHWVEQQLCRWLLTSLDRLASNELRMTQESIANMLGVRREGITEAAGKLQEAGLIRYRRGRITILDRAGLEARACECYAIIKKNSIAYCRRTPSEPSAVDRDPRKRRTGAQVQRGTARPW